MRRTFGSFGTISFSILTGDRGRFRGGVFKSSGMASQFGLARRLYLVVSEPSEDPGLAPEPVLEIAAWPTAGFGGIFGEGVLAGMADQSG